MKRKTQAPGRKKLRSPRRAILPRRNRLWCQARGHREPYGVLGYRPRRSHGDLKLTVRLPKSDLEFAKQYAQAHRITVTELIDRYLKSLRGGSAASIHPEVERISGLISPEVDARAEYREHAAGKHR